MAATSTRDLVLASVGLVTAAYADKGEALDGVVCGNTECSPAVYDHTYVVEVENEDGTKEADEFRASVADYVRTLAGDSIAAVNWLVEGGAVTRVSFLEGGAELIDNWDGTEWSSSDEWEV